MGNTLWTSLFAPLTNRIEANRTFKTLSSMSDRQLDDIGLNRGELWRVRHHHRF